MPGSVSRIIPRRVINQREAIAGRPVETYVSVTRDGRTQTWAVVDGRRYRIGGALADALIEAGVAWHNPHGEGQW